MKPRTGGTSIPLDHTQRACQVMASWLDSLIAVLESMTGYRSKAEWRPSPGREIDSSLAWWGQSLSILERPCFWIGARPESWATLGGLTLSALGVNGATDSDVRSTCRDLLAQTNSMVASQLARQFGEEIAGGDSIPDSQPDAGGALVFNWSLDAGQSSLDGSAVWSEAFLRRCSGFAFQPAQAEAGSSEASPAFGGEPQQFGGRTLESIPRLDLKVNFILGRTTLLLRDVFKLNVGSVIELDHSAGEPADIVIRDRVVARGEVVVVNGNYGLKILPSQPGGRRRD